MSHNKEFFCTACGHLYLEAFFSLLGRTATTTTTKRRLVDDPVLLLAFDPVIWHSTWGWLELALFVVVVLWIYLGGCNRPGTGAGLDTWSSFVCCLSLITDTFDIIGFSSSEACTVGCVAYFSSTDFRLDDDTHRV